ncbi:MAG TPA: hypothetical protein VKA15_18140, partial [Isosphaeraceae bacterium]|nr:hypothetical protein [Isosphaeraceae bacterium]
AEKLNAIVGGRWTYNASFVVVRFNLKDGSKEFKPFRHDSDGWRMKDPAGKLPLYHLDELASASIVWVLEGEKCCDLARDRLGLVATTASHGSQSPQRTDWSALAGKEVNLVPDNDQAGEEHVETAAGILAGLNPKPVVKVVRLPLEDKGDDIEQWLDAGGTVEQLSALASAAPEWKPSASPLSASSASVNQADDGRPKIEVNTERHLVVKATLKSLVGDPDLFRRGDSLGTVVEEESDTVKLQGGVELERARGCSRFLPLSDAALSCILTRNAIFFERGFDRNYKPIVKGAHPPNWLIGAVATWGSWPEIRLLKGIAMCPFVRADGSIPSPGYDVATGTLYTPTTELGALPDCPTQADATAAAQRLYDLVCDFPFAGMADRAVWLAALLTAIQRPLIDGPAPGFVFNGNKAGTGKGLLVDVIGLIAMGRGIPTRSYPADPVEAGKVKLSLALSGIAAVHFDNVSEGGFYGSSELDSALTSTMVEGRILGQSRESGAVPLRPCWFLTGNNISPWKDAYRRWLPCNLKTSLENPHERDDVTEKNLRQFVREHRAELLHDALVILKAHALAGRPSCGGAPLGSFEDWDAIVRGAVWFARGIDCLTTQKQAAKDSPERQEKLALLEAWSALPEGGDKGAGVTAAEAREFAEQALYLPLREALLNLSKDSKLPTSSKIGFKLRSMKGQNIGGSKFHNRGENRNKITLWGVDRV